MKAIILAGGFGERIMPLTNYVPKPLLHVGTIPVIDYIVSQLVRAGIDSIIFTLSFKNEQLIQHINGYTDIECEYIIEQEPLGTAGCVKNVNLAGDYFVLSGDCISDIDLIKMRKVHESTNAVLTIAGTYVDNLNGYGKIVSSGRKVTALIEKDASDVGKSGYANAGVYIVNAKAMQYVQGISDFAKDAIPALIRDNQEVSTYCHKGYWNDIGNIGSYIDANLHMIKKASKLNIRHISHHNIYSTSHSIVDCTAVISGQINNCVIGANVVICSNARLKNCVVLSGAVVIGQYENAVIGTDFICNNADRHINLLNLQKTAKKCAHID